MRDRQLLALTLLAIRQLGEGRARVSREGQSCPSWHAGPQPLNAQAVRDLLADGWLRPVGGGEDEVQLDAWPSFADAELLSMSRLAARSTS